MNVSTDDAAQDAAEPESSFERLQEKLERDAAKFKFSAQNVKSLLRVSLHPLFEPCQSNSLSGCNQGPRYGTVTEDGTLPELCETCGRQ